MICGQLLEIEKAFVHPRTDSIPIGVILGQKIAPSFSNVISLRDPNLRKIVSLLFKTLFLAYPGHGSEDFAMFLYPKPNFFGKVDLSLPMGPLPTRPQEGLERFIGALTASSIAQGGIPLDLSLSAGWWS